jgi:Zn-dependent protease with chaperone function
VNFFDAQGKARRATRWLVVIYIVATVLIVAGVTAVVAFAFYGVGDGSAQPDPMVLLATAGFTALFIIGASLYKTAMLSGGGSRVAQDMGGTAVPPDVRDPLRRRLRNVVEEMSIASGVPVPEIYVLEHESGINAFAAGFTPGDAVIAVTRGTLEILDRDELQGVIAHEFSHILNGDMRLNIRMMGVLFGIMVLGLIGKIVLRGSYHSSLVSSRRNKGAPAMMAIGIGLALLGWIGVFFARIVKAAVSRQREFLADASAVQFTRQPDGIANALKKIGGYSEKSYFQTADPEEISHMLFAGGVPRLASLFATHPPLTERIKAIDPHFSEEDYPQSEPARHLPASLPEQAAGFANTVSAPQDGQLTATATAIGRTVGNPRPEHIAYARKLRRSIPTELYDAAHSPDLAFLLAIALSLSSDKDMAERQLQIVREQLGSERAISVERYSMAISEVGPAYHLPLLEIAFPMLKSRPSAQLEFLLTLVRKLIELDGHVDLREFCFFRILTTQLSLAIEPTARPSGNRVSKSAARNAALALLQVVAREGSDSREASEQALQAGAATFGKWANEHQSGDGAAASVEILSDSLDVLQRINLAGRQSLIQSITETVTHDGRLTLTEAEMLRAICATLDCPLPPILAISLN